MIFDDLNKDLLVSVDRIVDDVTSSTHQELSKRNYLTIPSHQKDDVRNKLLKTLRSPDEVLVSSLTDDRVNNTKVVLLEEDYEFGTIYTMRCTLKAPKNNDVVECPIYLPLMMVYKEEMITPALAIVISKCVPFIVDKWSSVIELFSVSNIDNEDIASIIEISLDRLFVYSNYQIDDLKDAYEDKAIFARIVGCISYRMLNTGIPGIKPPTSFDIDDIKDEIIKYIDDFKENTEVISLAAEKVKSYTDQSKVTTMEGVSSLFKDIHDILDSIESSTGKKLRFKIHKVEEVVGPDYPAIGNYHQQIYITVYLDRVRLLFRNIICTINIPRDKFLSLKYLIQSGNETKWSVAFHGPDK